MSTHQVQVTTFPEMIDRLKTSLYIMDLRQTGYNDVADALEVGLLNKDEAQRIVKDRQLLSIIGTQE